jgi:hypothetical protein
LAAVLVLDWERTSCRLVAAQLGRQGVEVSGAAVWRPDEELSPKSAASLGGKLRDFLKTSGLPQAPVLISVGRDRVVLKEIHYPPVPAPDEPALVRFQATKDLAESPESVVLDYAPLTDPATAGERHSLAVILRREIMNGFQQLCRAAGLKLLGVVPRPFGAAGCLQLARLRGAKVAEAESLAEGVAVLLLGPRWAELDLLQGSKLLFSRSLAVGPTLAAEVRRSLMAFSSQVNGTFPRPTPRALYVAGDAEGRAPLLGLHTLGMQVHELDFLTAEEKVLLPAEDQSAMAAGLGLLQAWYQKVVPVNLASPREPVAVVDHGRRRRFLALAAGVVVLVLAWFYGNKLLADKQAEIQSVADETAGIDEKFKRQEQDRVDLEALKEWEKGAVRWIDEFYDLAARFPRETGFRLTKVQIEPIARRDPKHGYVARLTVRGVVPRGKEDLVHTFIEAIRDRPHRQAQLTNFKGQSFTVQVELAGQPATDYRTQLITPSAWSAAGGLAGKAFRPSRREGGKR